MTILPVFNSYFAPTTLICPSLTFSAMNVSADTALWRELFEAAYRRAPRKRLVAAALLAVSTLGICGELADTAGLGTFHMHLLDQLSTLSDGDYDRLLRIH